MATKKDLFPRAGILAALYIPTDAKGRLLKRELAAHLAWLRAKGVVGVLALGSTGEFPYFDLKEKKALLETIAELAAPMTVIAHITDIRPWAVKELGKFARKLGLPGVALMAPSFFKASQADILAYLLQGADAADLPVMLYNFPELVGSRLGIEIIEQFAKRANMGGIKQSGGEFAYHQQLIALGKARGFSVFSGADTRIPEILALGAAGCIGGMVNFVPEPMVGIFKALQQNPAADVTTMVTSLKEVAAVIDQLTFPLNVVAAMEARGFNPGTPKAVVSKESAKLYGKVVAQLKPLYRKYGLAKR
jgi:dihydrodipicolinate synthase/N-acetylneuraminate lyase